MHGTLDGYHFRMKLRVLNDWFWAPLLCTIRKQHPVYACSGNPILSSFPGSIDSCKSGIFHLHADHLPTLHWCLLESFLLLSLSSLSFVNNVLGSSLSFLKSLIFPFQEVAIARIFLGSGSLLWKTILFQCCQIPHVIATIESRASSPSSLILRK